MCIATADKRLKNSQVHTEDMCPSASGAWLLWRTALHHKLSRLGGFNVSGMCFAPKLSQI